MSVEHSQAAETHEEHATPHAPAPSFSPVLMAVGIALLLTGLVLSPVMVVLGAIISLGSLAAWVTAARRDYRELRD
jgi:hypothetical protein